MTLEYLNDFTPVKVCRACGNRNLEIFLNLGFSPIANKLEDLEQTGESPRKYPLVVLVCVDCSFLQLSIAIDPTLLFPDTYVYHSSFSSSWLSHCSTFVDEILDKYPESTSVVEIASNDGYLLEIFQDRGLRVLGIEPALEVARVALSKKVDTLVEFFNTDIARKIKSEFGSPSLICGNNVLAHVPDINEFVSALAMLANRESIISIEFPHYVNIIRGLQFDTIYHEHYSYLGLTSLVPLFRKYGLEIFEVEKLQTHGGSLRIFARLAQGSSRVSRNVDRVLSEEEDYDPRKESVKNSLRISVLNVKDNLLSEVHKLKKGNFRIAAYGAAAKGVTLLNFCGLGSDILDYVVDANPAKQRKLFPGTNLEIVPLEVLYSAPPDYLLVLPWNIVREIKGLVTQQLPTLPIFVPIPEIKYF